MTNIANGKGTKLDDKFSIRLYDGPHKEKMCYFPEYENLSIISPVGTILPHGYEWNHEKFQNFAHNEGDVWVVSMPKAGTTWTQEMVWTILFGCDHERAQLNLMKRFPFFEWDALIHKDAENMEAYTSMANDDPCKPGVTWKYLHNMDQHPRTIKTHLHYELLPKHVHIEKPKLVYVCRDPKDVCVSNYYHSKKFDGFTESFDEFLQLYINDAVPWAPYWKHVLDFWNLRNEKNVLFLRFEDLKQDLPSNIRKVANFLNKTLTDAEVEKLTDHLSFSSMSKNKATNNEFILTTNDNENKNIKFMRKGQVGDWKNHFSEQQIKDFKEWTMKNIKNTDFPYYQDFE